MFEFAFEFLKFSDGQVFPYHADISCGQSGALGDQLRVGHFVNLVEPREPAGLGWVEWMLAASHLGIVQLATGSGSSRITSHRTLAFSVVLSFTPSHVIR